MILLLTATLLVACGDKDDGETGTPGDGGGADGGSAWTVEQGVCGRVVPRDGACGLPTSVPVLAMAADGTACDDAELWDTGFSEWTQWWEEVAAEPAVDGDGRFEAALEVGAYAVRQYDDCYGCVAFSVAEGACAEVELETHELIFADAPNVYLYPTRPQPVSVRVAGPERISASDPEYPVGGWQVEAHPDGLLRTADGVHDFLFYELTVPLGIFQTSEGWCADGAQAQASIEQAMAQLGFNAAEIEDFAEFWDPVFPDADQLSILPQVSRLPALEITPRPDHLLRAWFVVVPGCLALDAPELHAVPRAGYHAAEWGVILDARFDRPWVRVE